MRELVTTSVQCPSTARRLPSGKISSGWIIIPLPRQHRPVVETLRGALEVSLAVESGLVAGLLQQLGKCLLVPVKAVAVVHEAVLMAVLTTENGRAAGATNRIGAEAIAHHHALGSELIDGGSRVDALEPAVVGTDGVRGVIIREDEQDVRFILFGKRQRRKPRHAAQSKSALFHNMSSCLVHQ